MIYLSEQYDPYQAAEPADALQPMKRYILYKKLNRMLMLVDRAIATHPDNSLVDLKTSLEIILDMYNKLDYEQVINLVAQLIANFSDTIPVGGMHGQTVRGDMRDNTGSTTSGSGDNRGTENR